MARSDTNPDESQRRLVILQFDAAPGLDKVSLNSIFRDEFIVSLIPEHLRKRIGTPCLCFKYPKTIGSHWMNAKRIAQMSASDLSDICNKPCSCSSNPDSLRGEPLKQDGHLLTTNCGILPSQNLCALGKMGKKYRPHDCPSYFNPDTKTAILEAMRGAFARFAQQATLRVNTSGCMDAWMAEVNVKLKTRVDQIPLGTLLSPHEALPYSDFDGRTCLVLSAPPWTRLQILLYSNAPKCMSKTLWMTYMLVAPMRALIRILRA